MRSTIAGLPFPLVAAVALLMTTACSDRPSLTGPDPAAGRPGLDIADATRDYKAGFYWLPPMVKQPASAGTFDPDLSPSVEICQLAGDACAATIATYTTVAGPGSEVVRLDADEQHYRVNWHTNEFDLTATQLYRISVRAGPNATLLGYADIQPVANGSGLKRVDTDEYIGLVDGRTLPIKFRIETGIVGSILVEPSAALLEPTLTQQFVAVVRDLHDNTMAVAVSWASSDGAVATVNETGLATAIAEGASTITAAAARVTGTATLTVDRIVGSVEVQPLEVELEPDATQQFIATVRDRQGLIMSAEVTWASSDEAVATVNQTGLATAVDDGAATITATAEGVSGTATITVEGGVVLVSSGRGHACALNPDGRAFCWGRNDQGQLGIGTLIDQLRPTAVDDDLTFVSITSGDFHTCALNPQGRAYCWGVNSSGELGDGTLVRRLAPVPVNSGPTFVSISAGARNTCALTADGDAYCWGEGAFGALGNGSNARATTPQLVAGGHEFASISAGQQYACAVTTDHVGYCWGNGGSGKLGNGSATNRFTPIAVSGALPFASIRAGDSHTCGVTTAGVGYCWGLGQFGRLGNNSQASTGTPALVLGGHLFAEISAGGLHTCGVTTAGKGYCWGGNIDGSLGDGTGLSRTVPTAVAGNHIWLSISASGLIPPDFGGSSNFAFSCGVTVENQTYCWGSGFHGQLGNGSTAARNTPTPIAAFP